MKFGKIPLVFKRWFRDDGASASLEFALLVIPFIMICMCILELAIMFASASMLEYATGNAARLVRTGQIQQASADQAAQEQMFRDALCEFTTGFVSCDDIDLEATAMGGFDDFDDFAPEFDADGNMISSGFDAGGVSSVMLIRAGYRHTLITPFLSVLLSEGGSGPRYFMSTIVLQTEPYEFVADS